MFANCAYIHRTVRITHWPVDSNFSASSSSVFPAARLLAFAGKHAAGINTQGWWDLRGRRQRERGQGIPEILGSYCQHHGTSRSAIPPTAEPRRLRQLRRRRRHIYLTCLAAAIVLLFAHSQSSQANRLTVWPGGCVNHFFRTRIIYTQYVVRIYRARKCKYISYRLSSLTIFRLLRRRIRV